MNDFDFDPNQLGHGFPITASQNGGTLNVFGDLTFVTHKNYGGNGGMGMGEYPNPNQLAIQNMYATMALALPRVIQQAIQIGYEASKIANNNQTLLDSDKAPVQQSKLITGRAEDAVYSIRDDTAKNDEQLEAYKPEGFTFKGEKKTEFKINVLSSSFKTVNLSESDEKLKFENLQEQFKDEDATPLLFSSCDNKSCIVTHIYTGNAEWRSRFKNAILQRCKFCPTSFFKDKQDYVIFLYSSNSFNKASSCIYMVPLSLQEYTNLEIKNDWSSNVLDSLKSAVEEKTEKLTAMYEPIVPSDSNITTIKEAGDDGFDYLDVNPVFSKSINNVRISFNLANLARKRIY